MLKAILAVLVLGVFSPSPLVTTSVVERGDAGGTAIQTMDDCPRRLPVDRRHKSCRGRSGRWW